MSLTDLRPFRDPGPLNVPMNTGLWLNPSRITAPMGSLTNVRNFEVVNGAYEESQGLTIVGPTLSEGLDDFWHADFDTSEIASSGDILQGDLIYWYANDGVTVAGTGRMYYVGTEPGHLYLTVDKVTGISPRRANNFYTSTGATIEYFGDSDSFTHQSRLGLSWADYKGAKFLGALSAAQREYSLDWDAIKPDPIGVQGISGVFQDKDSVYAARDFFGGRFTNGVEEPFISDEVEVNYASVDGSFTALVAGYQLIRGSWEGGDAEGYLYLYPGNETNLDMSFTDNWDDSTIIVNNTTGNNLGTCMPLGERQYENKGCLWKRDVDDRQGGWKYIDLGYSLSFEDGAAAPTADIAPLINSDGLDSITDTGFIDLGSPASEFPLVGSYSAWADLDHVDSTTPGAYASTTIPANGFSRIMELNLRSRAVTGDAKVLGISVRVTGHCTTPGDNVTLNKLYLTNKEGSAQYQSANRAEADFLNDTPGSTFEYGGQLDTWEMPELSVDDLQAGRYYLNLQFSEESGTSRTINIDKIQIRIYYSVTGQEVYFYNGTTDVVSAILYAYQVFDGDWSTDDAEGWMTIYFKNFVGTPSVITPGTEIRSAAGGGGELIAKARTISKNMLPSTEEMENANSIYQARVVTFSGEDDDSSAYVATGASPAFVLDKEDRFSYIRLPIDRSKDKPRYVEFHRNHLMLAVKEHFLVSSVGAPNNFNTFDGATTWNPKDNITGLAAAANGSTMIACQDSMHYFTGSGASGQDSFALRMITDNSGALPYTISNLLGNVFVDYAGISTADLSDKYGEFEIGRKSAHIRTLLRRLVGTNAVDAVAGNRVVAAIPVRKKNQYRIYLANGEIVVATFPDEQGAPLQFTRQNYTAYREGTQRGYEATFAPTAIDSSVLSNGDESIVMGTRLGHVMRIDPKYMDILSYANKQVDQIERRDSLSTWKFFKYLDFTPLHADDPSALVDYKSAEIYLEHDGYSEINHIAKKNYDKFSEVPDADFPELTVGTTTAVGDYEDFPGTIVDDYMTWYLNTKTDGLSLRLSKFGGDGSIPLRINSMLLHAEVKADRRNRISEDRDYVVRAATVPVDVNIIAETATAVAEGGLGNITLLYTAPGITGTAIAEGGQGEITLAPNLWRFDQMDITFDEDVQVTWDGLDLTP